VDAADVAVAHLPREHDLLAEAALHLGVGRDLGPEDLDGDDLLELAVPGLVDHSHPALAEGGQDLETAGDDGSAEEHRLRAEDVAAVEAVVGRLRHVGLATGALHRMGRSGF
jgi:hypothetical protein